MRFSGSWAARLIVFVSFLDLFSQFPIVAPYARSLGAGPLLIGVSVATYDVANLLGNLVTPILLARWGSKRPLVFGALVMLMVPALALVGTKARTRTALEPVT